MPGSDPPTYRINAAARLSGLSEHLLRVWERRYLAVQPHRSESGVRLYRDADVERLRLLKRAAENGHSISSIAALSHSQLLRLAGAVPQPGPVETHAKIASDPFVRSFLDAVSAMDLPTAAQLLQQADAAFGARNATLHVVIPILDRIGQRWESGELAIAQEHAATVVVRNYLGSALRALVLAQQGHLAISTTLAGEQHEFGALVAAVYAASHGLRVAYLGPSLPAAEVARAAGSTSASVVLLSAVCRNRGLRGGVDELRRQLPERTPILMGGAAASRLRRVPAGVTVLARFEDLGHALQQLPD